MKLAVGIVADRQHFILVQPQHFYRILARQCWSVTALCNHVEPARGYVGKSLIIYGLFSQALLVLLFFALNAR